ncbi:hypothetical protein EX895_002875 [Sporisorium graminicola]|uniref:Zn(2)-C6 fungal-type domain-containing protein n=1 Tax=Sporisorium graminicola TaxID=280036 RepID=A0A4U7KU60_9BASI|nr:hypothetical protein EX895_002875 [Sporisorium graminicola]TKY88165.1 hypothetical protein EX895_002875 [Sporisorium graminicola]
MSSLHHPRPIDDDQPANKRRKVNTCLQCKARKVKCDKVRPLCGPCQRRRIPADRCVFADEADPETLQHYLGPDYVAQQGFDMNEGMASQPNTSAAGLLGLQSPHARAVLDRLAQQMRQGQATNDELAAAYGAAGLLNGNGTSDAAAAAAAAVAAGDPALAGSLLASGATGSNGDAAGKGSADAVGSLLAGNLFPFACEPTHDRTKLILGLLPNDHVVNVLLDSLRTFESKSPLGISWRLIRVQLINLRGDISDWRTGQVEEPDVDLTFLALLFELMVSAIDCKPIDEIISEGIALTAEQVPDMTDQWHATCQALLAMSNFSHEPNLNTVCTEFLFYLYELRRGRSKVALDHLRSSFQSAQRICMHQMDSAQDDAVRWQATAETDDLTIRTGAVTAMRKAQFEGGDVFAIGEEQNLLDSIRSLSTLRRRELLQTNIPDRTHLVREAARMLWVSITWHLELVTPPWPLGERIDDASWTTRLSPIDEAHLSDGETAALPTGSNLNSISTLFFQFLSASTSFLLHHPPFQRDQEAASTELLSTITEWNSIADTHLGRLREQAGDGRAMLHHFALVIHHWTRIRLLRPYLGQLQGSSSLAASRATLIASCSEALLQVQKIIAKADVDLSIFQPVVTAVKVDAALILALHLLHCAGSNDTNSTQEWRDTRKLAKTSLLLMWTHAAEAAPHRLGSIPPWRKHMRQLVEEVLLAAFERKKTTLREQPRVKNEEGEVVGGSELDREDRLDAHLGALGDHVALKVYRDRLLDGGQESGDRLPLFFDVLDGYLRSL